MSSPAFEFRPSSMIEFEVVDPVAVARQAQTSADTLLDTDPMSINFGRRKDCQATAAERMLSGPAIDWLIAFPADARPKALCERLPHVANRLASEWPQAARSVQSLRTLSDDPRWGQAGYPLQVQVELQRLLRDRPTV